MLHICRSVFLYLSSALVSKVEGCLTAWSFFLFWSCIILSNERPLLPPVSVASVAVVMHLWVHYHCFCFCEWTIPIRLHRIYLLIIHLLLKWFQIKWNGRHCHLEAFSNYKRNSACYLQCSSCFTDAPFLIRLVLIRLQMQSCICISLLVCFEALSANNKPPSYLHSLKCFNHLLNCLLAGLITMKSIYNLCCYCYVEPGTESKAA